MEMKIDAVVDHLKRHKFIYAILAFCIIANIKIFIDLAVDWYIDGNYSHGFLIIPVSVFLLFRKRKEISFPAPKSRAGLVLFAAGCALLVFGVAASEYFTTRVSMLMLITGLVLYYLGMENFKKVWFSFFFLLFMIPVPNTIYFTATLPMQLFSSKVTNLLLNIIGVPSVRHGNIIYLPQYTLEVVEACSGLRSLVTLMALSALYGYITLKGRVRPVILFLASFPIAIAANVFRLFITAVGAYSISVELAEGFLHEISGLFVFMSALIMIVLLGAILKWERKPS